MNKINPILNNAGAGSVKNNTAAKSSSFQTTLAKETKSPASLNTYFEQAAKKYQIPVTLLKAMGKAESDFNPNAVSSCGAQGVMQLMPATAKSLGVTNAFDPEQNIMGGAKYIATLLDRYDGNVKLAVAAYNAGSGNVHKYGGIPPFKETQNYVKKVCAYMQDTIAVPNTPVASPGSASASSAYPVLNGTGSLPAPGQTASSLPSALSLSSGQTEEEARILTIEDQLEQFSYSDYLLLIKLSGLLLDDSNPSDSSSKTDRNTPDDSKLQEAVWNTYPGISSLGKPYLSLNPSSPSSQKLD